MTALAQQPPQLTATASARRPRTRVAATSGPVATIVATALAVIAGLAVWLVVFAVFLSGLVEHHDQSVLYAQLRQQIATQYAPVGGTISHGAPVAVLDAPGLPREVVVDGTASAQLRSGPGLLQSSPLPGQPGTTVIMGRSTTFGAPFGQLHRLTDGDRLSFTTGQGTYGYRIVGQVLAGGPIPTAYSAASNRLELITSDSRGFLGIPTPGRTRYVYAVLVGPAGGFRGTQAASAADAPNATDTAGLYPMVLWLQLLVVVAAAVTVLYVRAARRFRAHAWLLGLPLALTSLWGASSALFSVLPNLL